MNIVQVNYAFDERLRDPDGLLSEYHTLTGWSEALLAAGAREVSVVQRFHHDADIERNGVRYLFRHDVPLVRNAAAAPFRRPGRLHRTVVDRAPDVVHVNGLHFAARTWLLRRALPPATTLVVQDHAGRAPCAIGSEPVRRVRQAVRRRAMRAVDGFLFGALELAVPWREAGYLGGAQPVFEVLEASTAIRPVPRGDARARTGLQGAPAILWVGRLNRNKDPLTVLDGFERTLPRLPGAVLTMIYSADDLLPLIHERLRRSPALSRQVRLIGRVPHQEMAAYFSAADVFVLGSHYESCGFALLEACACGTVPAVTGIPTFRVITKDGAVGALWKPGDPAACARALVEAASADLMESSRRVRAHFERALSWKAVGEQAIQSYLEIASRTRHPAPGTQHPV